MLKAVNVKFDNKLGRGTTFKFMWLDVAAETPWGMVLNASEEPEIVVLNPGRRKRYVKLEGPISIESISELLERINGGDARFKHIPGDLPPFEFMKA